MIALPKLAAPAKRALMSKGVNSLDDLCSYTRREVKNFHGVGPNAMRVLQNELTKHHLTFKREEPST
ncbi:hypothetical protein [Exiguobacterium sp. B2(2022)]|uniref:hypothetical protein n=1 Tax=Exiguobacterium sp. B2(2022) TaxID=2992755 RepID=UPI00237A6106|nr:hypothetical protein [Exiguobacterium sp. B2(2022)]MDE0563932.1 hypothetical protein [Exiguobacterium sp. B2(2022)]